MSAFFAELGFEVEGSTFLVGEFLDTAIGIPSARTEMVLLRPPDDGTRPGSRRGFVRPEHEPGSPAAMATRLGPSNVSFEVEGLEGILDRLNADGYRRLIGGVGEYDNLLPVASVRGPEGIIVNLAERID